MTTIASLFSGGEGVGVGAKMAGLRHLWGIEYDDAIAAVARLNGFNTLTANVLAVDPATMPRPDVLHASPVCTRASNANANGKECQLDINTATATAHFITVLKPDYFTLENVYPYRKFKSFKLICDALADNGYSYDYWHLNAADYGVPQTRRRLILIAKYGKGQKIPKPIPTHHNPDDYHPDQLSMFAPVTKPWVGWYEAIEDLIPELPESQFAPWQLARLPEELTQGMIMTGNSNFADSNPGKGFLNLLDTANTVTSGLTGGFPKAFILDGKLNDNSTSLTARDGHKRFMTVTTSHNNRDVKAFLAGNNANDTSGAAIYADAADPAQTVRTPTGGRVQRTWLSSGRVVKMTPRALARFQSFPDWYKLPDKTSLAVKVIGNAVPPLLYQRVIEAIIS